MKKKHLEKPHYLLDGFFKRSLRCMKITVIFLFLFSGAILAESAFSQAAKVNINARNTKVKDVLREIEKQSDYLFIYNPIEVNIEESVSLNVQNKTVKDVLSAIFSRTNVVYAIEGNNIVLMKKPGLDQTNKKKITGNVTDERGDPVIGASISLKGTSTGTISDINGDFTIEVLPESVLLLSYIGYQTMEMQWSGQEAIKLTMKENTELLDEVVVVGFSTQKKANLTGSVSQVKMQDVLGDRPVNNVVSALQGSIPGLTVSGGSNPGQTKSFNIRGIYSFKQDGSTVGSPLILIDNVEGDIDMLNPEDIESVTVLKDAASSAIYGARAAGGVILITTKRPSDKTRIQINYNFNLGFEQSINKPKQAGLEDYLQAYLDAEYSPTYWARSQNVEQWLGYVKEYKKNPSSFSVIGDGIYVDKSGIPYYLNENDLYANMLNTGVYSNHNLSVLGEVDKLKFRISGGYSSEDGPLVTSKDMFNRKNLTAFLSADITTWLTQEVNISYTESIKTMPKNETSGFYGLRLISYYPEGLAPMSLIPGAEDDLPYNTPLNMISLSNKEKTVVDLPRIFLKSTIKPIHIGENPIKINFEYTYSKKNSQYDYY